MPTHEVDYKTLAFEELYEFQYKPSAHKVPKLKLEQQAFKNTNKANKQTQERNQKRAEKYANTCVEE